MATAEVIASPANLERTEAEARRLLAEAYSAQPVAQPDGSTLLLCWDGRISRAWRLWQEAKESGNQARADKLEQAALLLDSKAKLAKAAAEKTASDLGTLVSKAGRRLPDDLYPPACQCEGCQREAAQLAYFASEQELRTACAVLLEPAQATNMPALVALIAGAGERKDRDLLWRALRRISEAQQAYAQACADYGQTPNWRRAMYGEPR